MDIALKLKRAFATIATVALFATNASVVIAQTFTDVPTDAWYYDYVEQLVDDGVIDAGDMYRPDAALNRAELVKIVITATDGLAGYEAPATPTFDDVPTGAWYYDYVEAAVQLGIVNGYTDASGNLTGYFGPADTTNRAAATKILVNAFSVPTDLVPASDFPDVTTSAWYYDYVVTAYNQSVLDGYANGYFGPADPVTRAQVAKLTVNAQNPVERVVGEGEGEGEGEGTSEGALEVSLNDDTPASSTLPRAASSVDLLSFDLTAADDSVNVTQIVVTRGGVGQTGDWDALYLYNGTSRLTTGRTINSDTNTATFPISLTIDAGTTITLRLVGDVAAAPGASNQHYFYVASAADVTSNAQSVAGDFPTVGNTFTMGGAGTTVNTLTVSAGTAPSQPQIGALDAEVASVKMVAGGTNDIAVHAVALSNGGSLSSDKLLNCRLLRGTDEVATADEFDGDRVTFTLGTPYVIPEGQTKTFYVRCDIDGGRTTDTIRMYLDEGTDLTAIDQQYGYGAVITNTFNTAAQTNTITLKGGAVTVTDNGPAASQIAQNTTNNELLNFALTVDRDLTVRDTFIQVDIQDGTGAGPTLPATNVAGNTVAGGSNVTTVVTTAAQVAWTVGDMIQIPTAAATEYRVITVVGGGSTVFTVATLSGIPTLAATVTEVNPYEYVKNVRLVDLDSGSTLAGPLTYANSGATLVVGPPESYSKLHSEDYELTGGETRHMSIQADVDQNMAAGYSIRAQVQYSDGLGGDSYLKDLSANEFVAEADIVGAGAAALAGKWMTTATNSLTVGLASTPTSQTYVKGDSAVPSLGIALTAGDAGDITAKKLTVRVYADSTGGAAFGALGDIAANTIVSSVTLYDGADVVAGPKSLTLVGATPYTTTVDWYKAQFDDLNIVIPKGGTKTLTAKVTLLNTMAANTYIALDVDPDDDIIAEDTDSNTITATPTVSLNNTGAAMNPEITVLTSGSLDAYSEGNPDAANLVAGSTNQLVAKYRFKALREGFTVNKLTITNDTALAADGFDKDATEATAAVSNITVKYPDINSVTQSKTSALSAGSTTLSGLGFYVPAGEDVYLEVYADVSSMAAVGAALSGQGFRLGLQDIDNTISTFEAVGTSSSSTENFLSAAPGIVTPRVNSSATVKNFVVRKTMPTFAKASGSTNLVNGENTMYGLTITADAAGSVGFARLVFDYSLSVGVPATPKFYRGSTLITDATLTDTGTEIIVAFDQEETVSAGSSKTYYLKATVAGAASGDSLTTSLGNGDESAVMAGLTANMGQIYVAVTGVFTAAANDLSTLWVANRNIIWSDKSSDTHAYPTVAGGVVTIGTGSADWTNGYLLKATELTSNTLSY